MKPSKSGRNAKKLWFGILAGCCLAFGAAAVWMYFHEPGTTAQALGIEVIHSSADFNRNGIDDYADFVAGAKIDAKNHPRYDPAYVPGGYPEDSAGVCTDVIWRAMRKAGYALKDMVDMDIAEHPEAYPSIAYADPNIDFRRVPVLHRYFARHALPLGTELDDPSDWQAGDIVIFGDDTHIGILSDKRSLDGFPFVIHNGGQPRREENYLPNAKITARYRFDASRIDPSLLAAWQNEPPGSTDEQAKK